MKKVIVVDDEPIFRMDIIGMLTELEFDVIGEAADGFDAIELCKREKPDIILMDVKMPIFDGLSATETIISEELADCIILLTAFKDYDIVERAKAIGVAGYLVKPVDQRMLLPTIEIALAQSLRLKESRRETAEANQRLEENKIINRAQNIIADEKGISGMEAYNYMRSLAMKKRCSIVSLSQTIANQHSDRKYITNAKHALMERHGMSETAAYKHITKEARRLNCLPGKVSISILNDLELEHGG